MTNLLQLVTQFPSNRTVLLENVTQFLSELFFVGCVAAITTLGGKQNEGQERVDYMGNSNVIEQAGILGVERIILVTR
jgi:hypothetical protein